MSFTAAAIALAALLPVACAPAGEGRPQSAGPVTTTVVPVSVIPGATGTTSPSPAPVTTPADSDFGYEPLWPFRDSAEAAAWQQSGETGHQPWHLDAGTTAQFFTQQYLGFTEVNKVVKIAARGDEAQVSVGFDNPGGNSAVAAVLHLVRMGHGDTAPWEVVGSEDTTLTLTGPPYGSTVRSPMTVGGTVTGVDESLRVRILRPGSGQPVGQSAPLSAGGTETPWSTTISFADACPATLTVVVSTGGHRTDVERFAVTGVHC